MGRGVFRNYYKGHMDKTKGEGGGGGGRWVWLGWGVEGWGENADNCNRTTIKKKERKKEISWNTHRPLFSTSGDAGPFRADHPQSPKVCDTCTF